MKLRNKKTGKIIEYSIGLNEWSEIESDWFLYGNYDSIDELKEDWEDYKPKEPLIKDPKIRKVVRAWAECCGFSLLKHYFSEGLSFFICTDEEDNDYCCLDFTLRIDNLEYGKIYTITELCGSEE